ncbi:metal ABC transporter solute-binding protein, Zn/Mn family [Ulvibacter litoralis]|uniref:Manganese/zinc/iron transport system substrate-binding protein n=1 Tax=Ulvibacter litoralis TaxID=227084 RepID=A0A1G7D2I7_9FLAO|nr:zinc ABC transporter substrate-binding protein [Ulvibacter litoralis]GHC45106.1 manganese transporter [Ulvibacter litoralis]SDE45768.1 manganese/zinc/iron transport system substrate-binding protein [Ulvibacter litoralis]
MKKILSILLVLTVISCKNSTETSGKLKVVTTTTMVTDLVKNIGGDLIEIEGLMGAGVDPHLYKASEGDVSKLFQADVIFYNGLHLEGKLVEVFEKMEAQQKKTVALGDFLNKKELIASEYFASNYDPHVWFNIQFFKQFAEKVTQVLSEEDPINAEAYKTNNATFQKKLDALEEEVKATIATLPKEKRILVTAHDAFNYFGNEYGFVVVGLQGISTATEAGVQDVQRLSEFIITNKVKAIFIESSVPRRTIEALQQAVLSKNHEVVIGGSLYSDALGDANSVEGTYIGMFTSNVNIIVNALR